MSETSYKTNTNHKACLAALWNYIRLYWKNARRFPSDAELLAELQKSDSACNPHRLKQYKNFLKAQGKIGNNNAKWFVVQASSGGSSPAGANPSEGSSASPDSRLDSRLHASSSPNSSRTGASPSEGYSSSSRLRYDFSLMRLGLLFTGLSGLLLSAYFSYAYLAALLPRPAAWLLSASLAVFSSLVFQAMAFNRRHRALSLLFGAAWLMVAGFSGAANVAGQYARAAQEEEAARQDEASALAALNRQSLEDTAAALAQSRAAVAQAQGIVSGFDYAARMNQSRAYNNSLARLAAAEQSYAARLEQLNALRAQAAAYESQARLASPDFFSVAARADSLGGTEKAKFAMSLALPLLIELLSPIALCAAIALKREK